MNKYAEFILNNLLDKYERSVLSTGKATRELKITLKFDRKEFKQYCQEDSYLYRDEINQVCLNLEKQGYLTIQYEDSSKQYIEKVTLEINKVDEFYQYLKRIKKTDIEQNLIELLTPYQNEENFLGAFVKEMLSLLNDHKSVKKYFDYEDFKLNIDVLMALKYLTIQKTEILKRKFSIQVFNDSKRFENIESRVLTIIKDFYINDLNDEELLLEFNVIKNPTFIYLKGHGTFKINAQIIDLNDLNTELSLSTQTVENLIIQALHVNRILTIENLTTFYEYKPINELVIYLGGFHNKARQTLLLKLSSFRPDLNFYHWGDIDLGGFRIYLNLIEKTGIPFKAMNMDLQTIIRYKDKANKIDSEKYLNDLQKLLSNDKYQEFYDVINYCVANNIWLEQECIELN